MGEIVNLRRVRKAKTRADAERQAAENRAAFGRSKADKQEAAAKAGLAERLLDGHRRDTPPSGDEA